MTEKKLNITTNKKRFAEEFVIDFNGKQAAIRAGYSKKTAEQQASRLLSNVKVQNYISILKKEIEERSKMKVDECIQRLTSMARFDIADFYDETGALKSIHDIPEETRQAITELSVFEEFAGKGEDRTLIGFTKKVKLSDRRANLVELMKYLGAYEIHNKQKQNDTQPKDYSKLSDDELIQLARLEQKINSHD